MNAVCRSLLLPALLGFSSVPPILAEPPPAAAETREKEALPRARADDENAVRALLGKRAVITGRIKQTFESNKGVTFLNFDGGKFTAVVWKDRYDKFKDGSPARLYKDKEVEITGKVIEYKGKGGAEAAKLEIQLHGPEQVKILGEATATGTPDKEKKPAPAEEKKESEDARPAPEKEAEAKKPEREEKSAETKKPVDAKKYFK